MECGGAAFDVGENMNVKEDMDKDVDGDVDGKGFWVRPTHPKQDGRRKLLRKQIFTSLVLLLAYVVQYQPRVIVGVEQGGLIVASAGCPLVLEAACREHHRCRRSEPSSGHGHGVGRAHRDRVHQRAAAQRAVEHVDVLCARLLARHREDRHAHLART